MAIPAFGDSEMNNRFGSIRLGFVERTGVGRKGGFGTGPLRYGIAPRMSLARTIHGPLQPPCMI